LSAFDAGSGRRPAVSVRPEAPGRGPVRELWRWLATVAPLLLAGCVGIPFAGPPVQLAVGTGARSLREGASGSLDVPLQLRAAAHPLGFSPNLVERSADFGLGYLLDYGPPALVQGAYLEGSAVMLKGPLGNRWGRLSARVQARLLFRGREVGQGAAVVLTGEWTGFDEGNFDSTDARGGAFGYAYGEKAVGFFIEAAFLHIGALDGWSASGGLIVRIPAVVGFAWGWIWP